jgi:hypothetical protein
MSEGLLLLVLRQSVLDESGELVRVWVLPGL